MTHSFLTLQSSKSMSEISSRLALMHQKCQINGDEKGLEIDMPSKYHIDII